MLVVEQRPGDTVLSVLAAAPSSGGLAHLGFALEAGHFLLGCEICGFAAPPEEQGNLGHEGAEDADAGDGDEGDVFGGEGVMVVDAEAVGLVLVRTLVT